MRIIGGRWKRRLIGFPKTRQTRPVTDRAKETIFNVLGTQTEGACVLDLFAGSGSLGLEALSRGAEEAFFVDHAQAAMRSIRTNLQSLGIRKAAHVVESPVSRAIRRLEKQGVSFDLIFVDPPHNKGLIKKTLNQLDDSAIIKTFAVVVVGHSNLEGLPDDLKTLRLERGIQIGQTVVTFLRASRKGRTAP